MLEAHYLLTEFGLKSMVIGMKLVSITILNHIVKGLPDLLPKEKFGLKSMVIGMTLFLPKTQILKDDS